VAFPSHRAGQRLAPLIYGLENVRSRDTVERLAQADAIETGEQPQLSGTDSHRQLRLRAHAGVSYGGTVRRCARRLPRASAYWISNQRRVACSPRGASAAQHRHLQGTPRNILQQNKKNRCSRALCSEALHVRTQCAARVACPCNGLGTGLGRAVSPEAVRVMQRVAACTGRPECIAEFPPARSLSRPRRRHTLLVVAATPPSEL